MALPARFAQVEHGTPIYSLGALVRGGLLAKLGGVESQFDILALHVLLHLREARGELLHAVLMSTVRSRARVHLIGSPQCVHAPARMRVQVAA